MKLAIFGATGATGTEPVKRALIAGHQLTCLVRNPAAANLPANVTRLPGNVRDPDAVEKTVAGNDVVLSALGSRSLKQNDLLDRAMANILASMKKTGVRRIVVLGASGAIDGAEQYQSWPTKLALNILRNTLLKYPFEDQRAQERRLQASDSEYTVVRPPRLTNGSYTGVYRVEADGLPKAGTTVSRADVAEFMLKQLDDDTFLRRGVYIAR